MIAQHATNRGRVPAEAVEPFRFTIKPDKAPFIPTPEQIAEGCRQIQAEWSAEGRARRWHASPEDVETVV